MDRRLVMGVVAGLVTIALTAGGSTYSAFSDFASVTGNSAGAGFLKLDLEASGASIAPLDFEKLAPGSATGRTMWIAGNDSMSMPDANLFLTIGNLNDTPADCSTSLGKALAETASGISGCTVKDNLAEDGTPAQGNLSRVLSFQGAYYPSITSAADCQALQGSVKQPSNTVALAGLSGRGGLYSVATANGGKGTQYELYSAGTTPLVLHPGDGACVSFGASWIADPNCKASAATPNDAAAQGDSLTFDVRFDLVQV